MIQPIGNVEVKKLNFVNETSLGHAYLEVWCYIVSAFSLRLLITLTTTGLMCINGRFLRDTEKDL